MTRTNDTPLAATPELEKLLARLRRQLGALAWLQGLGVLLAALCAWLCFSFLADWALHVPRGVRWFHLAVCATVPVLALWRFGIRPWLRRPSRAGLALLIERKTGASQNLLVTAVQLQQARPVDAHPELIERVLRSAELEAARIQLAGVLDPNGPRKLFALGAAAALALVWTARTWPEHASIFASRLFGSNEPWPQLTQLELALGAGLEATALETTANGTLARLPRGSDAPIVVRAVGVRPREVRLHLGRGADGASSSVALTSGPDGVFRTVLRGLEEDLTLHATGGDDRDGAPTLTLVVLDPPDIAALSIGIEPPAYTGLARSVETSPDVEVLAGSRLSIAIVPAPAEASGSVRLLPADQLVVLEATTLPTLQGAAEAGASVAAIGFSLVASQSFRYRIELRDAQGLTNPNPGLFSVQVKRDERPSIEWLAPARNELETLDRGVVRLLARVDDDFAVAGVQWRAQRSGAEQPVVWAALELREAPPAPGVTRGPNARLTGARVEVASLAASERPLAAGDQLEVELRAFDARPGPAEGELDSAGVANATTLRLRIVTEDDFLRRLQDRLARVRAQVTDVEVLARERLRRTGELLGALEGDASSASSSDTTGLVSAQRRVQGDLEALARELASIVENVLYSRLDPAADVALADLDGRLAQSSARSFPMESWQGFAAAVRSAQVSAPGVPGQLVALLERALRLAAEASPKAVEALDRATRAADGSASHAALVEAQNAQADVHRGLTELLEQLAEWDNFQAVLTLTRDILTRQKAVRDRTRDASGADPRSDRK